MDMLSVCWALDLRWWLLRWLLTASALALSSILTIGTVAGTGAGAGAGGDLIHQKQLREENPGGRHLVGSLALLAS